MIKSKSFMDDVKDIVKNCGPLAQFEEWDDDDSDLDSHISVSGGESYDGFINFTDGFVDRCLPYVPNNDEHLTFKGFNKETRKNAENVQKVLDALESTDGMVKDYWYELDDDLKAKFEDGDSLLEWYAAYEPRQYHEEQLDLFSGKPCKTYTTDPKLDELYDNIQEYCDDYYSETCAFVGITVRLYDTDNYRNTSKDHKHQCVIESYFNDDLSYGRESVGAWAGKNIIGNYFGKQVIYSSEFEWTKKSDLLAKLNRRIGKAYESLGM